jgi:glycogen debranching enzyme
MPHGGEAAGFVQVLDGATFMLSDERGDVRAGSSAGLFHHDTRFLDRFELSVGGSRPELLTSHVVDSYSAAFYLTNADVEGLGSGALSIVRQRLVGDGLRERVEITNNSTGDVTVPVRLECGADFADVFEVKSREVSSEGRCSTTRFEDGVAFAIDEEGFGAEVVIEAGDIVRIEERKDLVCDLVFEPHLAPHESWETEVKVRLEVGDDTVQPPDGPFVDEERQMRRTQERFENEIPTLSSTWPALESIYRRSVDDLAALRLRRRVDGHELFLPAGGMPWFMAVLGRDALIIAYETLLFAPELARGTLRTLAALQSARHDDEHDAEPGKISHELRFGRLTATGRKPFDPYYGTVDATPLFLIVLAEHRRVTGDDELCRELRSNALAAIEWMERYGDLDGDGFLEYERRSSDGPRNQGWKDSDDSMRFADGRCAAPPIAVCEAQGYAYDARVRMAEVAAEVWGDADLAERLRAEAAALRTRFDEAFWIPDRDHYALAVDAEKRQVDSLTSDIGHLLWSGIVPEERARLVVRNLMSAPMFSGWGVRTMSAEDAAYNPISYHVGSVWPHDNAIVASGLRRYGFADEAARIARGILDAAGHFDQCRLPEVFAGYDRDATRFPVWYPEASSPQAFAAGAPLLLLRTVLGLDVSGGRLVADPALPDDAGEIRIAGVHALGKRFVVSARGRKADIAVSS